MESSIRFGIRHHAGKREKLTMRVIGNILWIILGGLAIAISWALIGLFLCITIIGIPLGVQAFKVAGLTLTPFGLQSFKMAKLALWPFGAQIYSL